MSNTTTRYPVKVPNGLMQYLMDTGVGQGSDKGERPEVKADLDDLKWTSKGASGEVSLYTLGWMADMTENGYLEENHEEPPASLKAGRAAAERYAKAYDEGRKAEKAAEPAGTVVEGLVVPLDYGMPVYHVRDTSRVVGFLTPGSSRFVSIEEVKAELAKANE